MTEAVTTASTSEETPEEARASEAALNREERITLQEALQWDTDDFFVDSPHVF